MLENVTSYTSNEDMIASAYDLIATLARESIEERGVFSLALSGGSTPRALFERFRDNSGEQFLPWRDVHIFWGDERCVPPDDNDSNYRMANDAFISSIAIPDSNVHRMRGEISPGEGAALYSMEMELFFGRSASSAAGFPEFDLILLGLGPDGHTASIFPESVAETEVAHPVIATEASPGIEPKDRITLTFPVLNNARNVLFLVAGESKRNVLESVSGDTRESSPYPSAKVNPRGNLYWYWAHGPR